MFILPSILKNICYKIYITYNLKFFSPYSAKPRAFKNEIYQFNRSLNSKVLNFKIWDMQSCYLILLY